MRLITLKGGFDKNFAYLLAGDEGRIPLGVSSLIEGHGQEVAVGEGSDHHPGTFTLVCRGQGTVFGIHHQLSWPYDVPQPGAGPHYFPEKHPDRGLKVLLYQYRG